MHNTTSNTNSATDWANRFVPLPPTEFPPESPGLGRSDDRATGGSGASNPPATQAKLPCLDAIAGVDPFFTPADTPAPLLAKPTGLGAPFGSPAEPVAALPSSVPAVNNVLCSPAVEVIGQQAENASVVTEKITTAESPLHQGKPEVELMNETSLEKSTVEIHEYDLAMKVLSNPDAVAQQASGARESVASESYGKEVEGNDITSYWGPGNVTSFVPGVTPIEAYPVCQEYADQISVSNDTELESLGGVASVDAKQAEQVIRVAGQSESNSGSHAEVGAITSAENLSGAAQKGTAIGETAEPLQVDPFDNDEFESVQHVSPVGLGNQASPVTPARLTEVVSPCDAESDQEVKPGDAIAVALASDEVSWKAAEAEAMPTETPAEACSWDAAAEEPASFAEPQVEPAPSENQSFVNPLDLTQAIPRLPSNVTESSPGSYGLFESVEQSLSDLQSINQLESKETLTPATQATAVEVDLPVQSQQVTVTSVEESVSVATPVIVEDPLVVSSPLTEQRSDADEVSALAQQPAPVETSDDLLASALASLDPSQSTDPVFAPVDLTAQLPAVPARTLPAKAGEPAQAEATPATAYVEPQSPVKADAAADNPVAREPESKAQVIQVDGNDGYDFLDLKAFDVSNAVITPGIIFLDDGSSKFQVEYRNLSLAVFANDFQVELN